MAQFFENLKNKLYYEIIYIFVSWLFTIFMPFSGNQRWRFGKVGASTLPLGLDGPYARLFSQPSTKSFVWGGPKVERRNIVKSMSKRYSHGQKSANSRLSNVTVSYFLAMSVAIRIELNSMCNWTKKLW